MKTGLIVSVVIVLAVVAVGLGLSTARQQPAGVAPEQGEPAAMEKKMREGAAMQPVKATLEQMPAAAPTAEEEPVAVAAETTQLAAIAPYTGSGTATRSFDGVTFTHTVEAAIGDPAAGKFYEGWLVKKQPSLTFFSTGKMTKSAAGYELTFVGDQAYAGYDDVVITEETSADGLDGKPEAHVLEGTF